MDLILESLIGEKCENNYYNYILVVVTIAVDVVFFQFVLIWFIIFFFFLFLCYLLDSVPNCSI